MSNNRIIPLLLALLISCLITAIAGLAYQLQSLKKQQQADLFYRMYTDFFINNQKTAEMIILIDNEKPILTDNGGKYDEHDLDNYLGHFELLKIYLDNGILNEEYIYDTYSYYIVQALKNKEVRDYIYRIRKEGKDSTFYLNTEDLAKKYGYK